MNEPEAWFRRFPEALPVELARAKKAMALGSLVYGWSSVEFPFPFTF